MEVQQSFHSCLGKETMKTIPFIKDRGSQVKINQTNSIAVCTKQWEQSIEWTKTLAAI